MSRVALLPQRDRPNGPVTSGRLRRTLLVYAGIWAVGVALIVAPDSERLAGLGLGLIAPGAGLLFHGHWLLAALTAGLFVLGLLLWLGSGNVLAPLAIWLWPIVVEMLHVPPSPWSATEWIVPALVACAVSAAITLREVTFRTARKRAARRDSYLRANASSPPVVNGSRSTPARELTSDQLAFARFALDRALQPVPEFGGFDRIEQFQSAAIRYQVCTAGYALAALQHAYTPAFHGYLSEAQRRLIAKMQERVCWAYWAKENLWGNFRLDPDPIPRDNIMLSGWLGYLVAGYVSNTGDDRYWRPGSISFRHPDGRAFEYDLHSLTEALARNFADSDFCLFPCEPNWIFALCNGWGVLPLPIHDRLCGTDYCSHLIPRFRQALDDEFTSIDGRFIGIRSALTGFSLPAMTSILSDCSVIYQISPLFPDIARRTWEIVRREYIDLSSDPIGLELRGWDKSDTGSHRRRPVTAHMTVMWAAREMGDDEVFERVREAVEQRFEPRSDGEVMHYSAASVQANFGLLLALVGQPGGHSDRVAGGNHSGTSGGPILDEASYPNVLVARAVTDGSALELVLRSGPTPGRRQLGLARLLPGRWYTVHGGLGSRLQADEAGRATLEIELDERREVAVTPEV